jgi:MFS family permease
VFTAASLGCALSPSLWPLVGFRLLQAAGAAALTPTSLGLLINAVPPEQRAGAVRIWAAVSALAAAAGPVIGGVLVQHSWRLVFLVNIPIGMVAVVCAVRVVPDSKEPASSDLPDLLGSGVLAVAIGALALALVKAPAWGWGSVGVLTSLAVALAGVALFWRRSLHQRVPVIDPALLRVGTFAWSNVTILTFSVAFAANLLLSILWMQDVWHFSPLQTGFGVAPGPLMVPGFAILGGSLARRTGVGAVAAAGCLLLACGIGLTQLLIGPVPHYFTELLPGQLIGGIGVGLALPTILSSGTSGLPPVQAATVNMSRQIGSVIGISVLVALLGTPTTYAAATAAFAHGRIACIAACLLAIPFALGMTQRAEPPEELVELVVADLSDA